jgi:hypothetical protein
MLPLWIYLYEYNQKVVGSIPTVARHIFQAFPVWIYTLRVTSQTSYSPEYIAHTKKSHKFEQSVYPQVYHYIFLTYFIVSYKIIILVHREN